MFKKQFCNLILLCTVACSSGDDSPKFDTVNAINITDFTGARVSLNKPAQRIIALAPNIVENVYSAGAGKQLVGVVSYSDFPEQASSLPLVGGYANINFEKILELKPDLIIAWGAGNSDASVTRIKALGYPVYVDQAESLSDLSKSIRDIGTLTGHAEHANAAMDEYLSRLKYIQEKHASKPKVRVFYQVWNKPLRTITGRHIISDAIRVCGGLNVYANEKTVSPIINIESLLERDPQAIIASGVSVNRPEWLDEWQQWPSLQAVKNKNVFFVNPDHIQRHTTRMLLGIDAVCTHLDDVRAKNDQ